MLRQVAGAHVQDWGRNNAVSLPYQTAGSLKILHTANSVELVREFVSRNPGSPVCCRYVGNDNLAEADGLVEQSIRVFEPMRNVVPSSNLWLEDGINEAYQSGEDLSRRNDAVERAAVRIAQAGFRPVGFNFSVGNPPKIIGAVVNG